MTLKSHLGAWYSAKILSNGNPSTVMANFREDLAGDPGLRAEAEAKLATYTQAVLDRDFVARVYKDFLQEALAT